MSFVASPFVALAGAAAPLRGLQRPHPRAVPRHQHPPPASTVRGRGPRVGRVAPPRASDLPQDTPLPRREAAGSGGWKPKKRGEEGRAKDEVNIPVAKKPITKSYMAQTALSLCLCAVAGAFFLFPETMAAGVFGLESAAFLARPVTQLAGALLVFVATLFFVLRELSFSYVSARVGYLGVSAGSVLALKTVLTARGPTANPLALAFSAVILFALGTAVVQLKKIQTYQKKMSKNKTKL
mmetsp:Transcript_3344/g.8264  ORF Transcript_3344/g.8264 Transcript_3344/m.8264 type:complete len:239 (-) Transcript_3344:112-828(-)